MSKNGSGEPPSWEELVSQVQGAMEELNLNSPENQALFVEGLKEVMESLESMGFPVGMGMPPMPPSAGAKKPDIQVFEGGKKESEDPKDSTEAPGADAETAPKSEEESAPKADANGRTSATPQGRAPRGALRCPRGHEHSAFLLSVFGVLPRGPRGAEKHVPLSARGR